MMSKVEYVQATQIKARGMNETHSVSLESRIGQAVSATGRFHSESDCRKNDQVSTRIVKHAKYKSMTATCSCVSSGGSVEFIERSPSFTQLVGFMRQFSSRSVIDFT